MSSPRRRPTMTQVARAAGVSTMTVSYTYSQPGRVSPELVARVLAAAEALGYPGPHPGARSLRRGRTATLGVVLGEHLTYAFEDPQAVRFLAGVADVCAANAVALTLVPVTGEAADRQRIAEAAVDGFVVWTTADDDPVLEAVRATGLPAVMHAGSPGSGMPTVGIDDRAAAQAVGRVAFDGSRRPSVLCFPLDRARTAQVLTGPDPDAATYPVTRNRLLGLRDAWSETGRPWTHVRVAVCSRNESGLGASAATSLLRDQEPPDAIAAMSDELALGALRACADAGVTVPGTVAVSGWDDADDAARAGLTTVRQHLREQGARCARLALGQGDPPERPGWEVVQRSSTRPTSAAGFDAPGAVTAASMEP